MSAAKLNDGIPDPLAPDSLTVTDGHEMVGTIVRRDGSHFAFDADGTLIGEYATRAEAMRALPNSPTAQLAKIEVVQ